MPGSLTCRQCGQAFWAADDYRPVSPPPQLPDEGLIGYLWRRWEAFRSGPSSAVSAAWCDECSAKNEDGWKAHRRLLEHRARLESIEKMLAGLRREPDGEPLDAEWDSRRAELISELEARRARLQQGGGSPLDAGS